MLYYSCECKSICYKGCFFRGWDGSASCNASDGELAAIGYSVSVYGGLNLLGVFLHQQWAGAEDGEGFRPIAGAGNERRKTGSLPVYVTMHRWGDGDSILRQTVIRRIPRNWHMVVMVTPAMQGAKMLYWIM